MTRAEQVPSPGSWRVGYRGDLVDFSLTLGSATAGRAWVRTNLGHAAMRRREIIAHVEDGKPLLDRDWHDIPMSRVDDGHYALRLPLLETGCFQAKTFFLPKGESEPLWPGGDNVHIKVQPAQSCCANSIYTLFARQFRPEEASGVDAAQRETLERLDDLGYAVIPRSGTFRDVIHRLDHIMDRLGFRIIQLLPIHPTPTTYARMGRFGSPFAAIDFMDVDPALAEFDRRTTPLDQFGELVDAVHARGGKLLLDIPVNHTGWASSLQIHHPEWFERTADDAFRSPGAWGVTWEDLSQLDYGVSHLWHYMADIFLFWCARGVDGFRCDAGYMVPFEVWNYVVARVRDQFPDTVFMLEGLGGPIEVTMSLMGEAGLDWAYSEIFQQYDRSQLEAYLPDAFRISRQRGTLINYAETHDNNRLASTSETYARMRTALCALCSDTGGFGITNGVEWFAGEKVDVHGAPPLNWGHEPNQVDALARINAILRSHPAFGPGVPLTLLPAGEGNVLALRRGAPGEDRMVLVLANLDCDVPASAVIPRSESGHTDTPPVDLLSGQPVELQTMGDRWACPLPAGAVLCLSWRAGPGPYEDDLGAGLDSGRLLTQSLRAKALDVIVQLHGMRDLAGFDAEQRIAELTADPETFCRGAAGGVPRVTTWNWPGDATRSVMVPPGDFLLVRAASRFHCELHVRDDVVGYEHALPASDGSWFALVSPVPKPRAAQWASLALTVYGNETRRVKAPLLLLGDGRRAVIRQVASRARVARNGVYGLLANNRGAMVQALGAWGELQSQYDALLAANLHPDVPVDRQVMLRRCRAWLVYRGYSQEISEECLVSFSAGSEALEWNLNVPAGLGKLVPLTITARLDAELNRVTLVICRHPGRGVQKLPDGSPVRLILRPDVEDRSMHGVTKAYAGAESDWAGAVSAGERGFAFDAGYGHWLDVRLSKGTFVLEPEWQYLVPHPFEEARGLEPSGDLFSPGYFTCALTGGETAQFSAEAVLAGDSRGDDPVPGTSETEIAPTRPLLDAARAAMAAFIVRRGELKTVIAGYPWFLDWGRDTLICLRGMIAAGHHAEASAILRAFGRLERRGTLPNMLAGDDDSNRDTSDAPLWFVVACRDLCGAAGLEATLALACDGRSLRDVLVSIGEGYLAGTENGIRVDPDTGLVFSPAHYTWMDTHHPAGTPRQGYAIEIQALWFAALSFLATVDDPGAGRWNALARQVQASVHELFVRDGQDFLSDCLHAGGGQGARDAVPDDALRPNQLFAITLGLVHDPQVAVPILRSCQELLVPGAIRSLANRPVTVPIEVRRDGQLLNDPLRPYWGVYRGDEDTRRKPAYHNGTAWSWPFPSYAEALVMIHGARARDRALSILSSSVEVIDRDCAGHVPEIVDGDAPHISHGCGAQAWGATELYRVLKALSPDASGPSGPHVDLHR